jgi:hypothetical protein
LGDIWPPTPDDGKPAREEKGRLTARAASRQEPNVQGGGWSRFGREDQSQRVNTYIVISKPKRISVKLGFVHIMGALRGGLKTGSS